MLQLDRVRHFSFRYDSVGVMVAVVEGKIVGIL